MATYGSCSVLNNDVVSLATGNHDALRAHYSSDLFVCCSASRMQARCPVDPVDPVDNYFLHTRARLSHHPDICVGYFLHTGHACHRTMTSAPLGPRHPRVQAPPGRIVGGGWISQSVHMISARARTGGCNLPRGMILLCGQSERRPEMAQIMVSDAALDNGPVVVLKLSAAGQSALGDSRRRA